jgi:carboxylesterase
MIDLSFKFGSGRTAIILVHGLTGTPVEMRGLGKALAFEGYSVYGVQLAGHCGSEADLTKTGARDWYASVKDVLDEVRGQHRQVFVGGLSMGALLALKAAADHPRLVTGVLLYSTTLFYDGWTIPRSRSLLGLGLALGLWRWWRFEEKFPYGIKDDRIRERILGAMLSGDSGAAGNLATPGASIRELHGLTREVLHLIPRVTCPALVVHARHDDVTSLRNADHLAAHLGGDVEKVVLEDSYHMVTLDQERDRVIRSTADFVARVMQQCSRPKLRIVADR